MVRFYSSSVRFICGYFLVIRTGPLSSNYIEPLYIPKCPFTVIYQVFRPIKKKWHKIQMKMGSGWIFDWFPSFFRVSSFPYPHILIMTHSDEDTLILHSIPNGVLKELRSEACHFHKFKFNSFLPMLHWFHWQTMFVDTNSRFEGVSMWTRGQS
jgi:hypothetical protein